MLAATLEQAMALFLVQGTIPKAEPAPRRAPKPMARLGALVRRNSPCFDAIRLRSLRSLHG